MGIEFRHVSKRFPDGTLAVDDLNLQIQHGELMIFVGPSGCGKTTALRMVAGLEEVTSGDILIDGDSVNGLEPVARDVAMIFQNYALYPHMSVRDNIAFPLRMQRSGKRQAHQRVRQTAELLGIEDLLRRKPAQLSGGQRQRVAMGRAIVREPRAFLMDEPLSNLDAMLRVQLRAELVKLHRRLGVTTLYVTHDQTEAMTLGERVAVLNRGTVQQVDSPARLYRAPSNTFVASFIGSPSMNFLAGTTRGRDIEVGELKIPLPGLSEGQEVLVGVRPEHLSIANSLQARGTLSFPAEVEIAEDLGAEVIAYLRARNLESVPIGERSIELAGALVARFHGNSAVATGERVNLAADLSALHFFDRETGIRLPLSEYLPVVP
jgi:multiple sugar transport system ATP-binding protein